MSKTEINNEIIILRKFVEQARVHIIKKLTRDIKKYRNKKGTDAQKAKNERKSDRLAAEILSIKKVKKDEITKYILTNNLNFKQVVECQSSTPLDRAMARIANHKIFSKKIDEFKSKYSNYMEFLGPGRKKKAIIEWKEKKKMKNKEVEKSVEIKEDNEESEILHSSDNEDKIESIEKLNVSSSNNEEEDEDSEEKNKNEESSKTKNEKIDQKVIETKIVKKAKLEKSTKTNLQKNSKKMLDKRKENDDKIDKDDFKQNGVKKRKSDSKIISKQAIVKKFTDILEEDNFSKDNDNEIDKDPTNSNPVEKEVDSFFMTGDEKCYLSIAAANKKTSFEDDNEEGRFKKNRFSRQQNDKSFGKVDKFKKNNPKFMTHLEDKKSFKFDGNADRYNREKKRNFESTSRNNGEKAKFAKSDRNVAMDSKSMEHLHPSWEAKRKEQEILKKGFQGKKIVFGDDV